jgi:hypothetical protein
MSQKIAPFHGEIQLLSNIELDHREGNRNPFAPMKHFIEIAIAWVIIFSLVADNPLLTKQLIIDDLNHF